MVMMEVCWCYGVSLVMFYKWKVKFGGMDVCDVCWLKVLEIENVWFKKLLVDSMLDNLILKDFLGKF